MSFYKKTSHTTPIVSTADMKVYMSVSESDHDDLIANLVLGAQDEMEQYLWQAFINTTYALYLPCFSEYIPILIGPVSAIASVQYYDGDNALQTLDSGEYIKSTDIEPAYVKITGTVPSVYEKPDAVKINFTAGYGATAADVPAVYIANLKRLVHKRYDSPMDEDRRWPTDVEYALFPYRKYRHGS